MTAHGGRIAESWQALRLGPWIRVEMPLMAYFGRWRGPREAWAAEILGRQSCSHPQAAPIVGLTWHHYARSPIDLACGDTPISLFQGSAALACKRSLDQCEAEFAAIRADSTIARAKDLVNIEMEVDEIADDKASFNLESMHVRATIHDLRDFDSVGAQAQAIGLTQSLGQESGYPEPSRSAACESQGCLRPTPAKIPFAVRKPAIEEADFTLAAADTTR